MKKNYNFKHILIGFILVIVAVNTIAIAFLTSSVSDGLAKAIELNRPAKLSAVVIKPTDCESCFDIDATLEKIKNANILIEDEKELKADSKEAQELITQYSIQKLPTIIFTGEIQKDPQLEKAWEEIGEIRNNAVIFTKLQPPYFDLAKSRVVGQVSVTYINDKACPNCPAYETYVNQLKQSGITVISEKTIDYHHVEAQTLIQKYEIARIPTFILDKEIALYKNVVQSWPRIGKVADDGNYIATQINAPYRDLQTNKIKGMITAIHLVDQSCTECMSVGSIINILSRFKPAYDNERIVTTDSAEGQALIAKYKIEKVPTVILDKETEAYPALKQAWPQIGTIEPDGSYVVRNLSIVRGGKYKDLTTDTIISN